jgi:hypothetical protein
MLHGMADRENPTARARWIAARKRGFYLVGVLVLLGAVAAAVWGAMSGDLVWFVVFIIALWLAEVVVLIPYMTGRYVNNFDGGSGETATWRHYLRLFRICGFSLFGGSLLLIAVLHLISGDMDWILYAAAVAGLVATQAAYSYRLHRLSVGQREP